MAIEIFKFSEIVYRGCGYELREHWEFDCRDILGRVRMTIQLGSALDTSQDKGLKSIK